MKFSKYVTLFSKWLLTITLLVSSVFVGVALFVVIQAPDVETIKDCLRAKTTQVLICEENPDYVPLTAVSQNVIDAVVYSEDAKFFEHKGFDTQEIVNSFFTNVERLSLSRGGSTITQQLVKNLFLSPEKTWLRKLTEAYLTIHVEDLLTKDQILEKYLNAIEFGPNIYGIKKASLYYFNKEPLNLNLLESVSLAYLLPNPKLYSKVFQTGELTKFARWRHEGILKSLKIHRKISNEVFELGKREISKFPSFSAIVATSADVASNDPQQKGGEETVFPPIEPNDKPINLEELEPGQQISSIDNVTSMSDKLGFVETHLNRDIKLDTIIIDNNSEETYRAQAFLFMNKETHFLYMGSIWINPSKLLVEPGRKKEFSSIYTFIPGDPERGDLIKYDYNNGEYFMNATVIKQSEAKDIFKNSSAEMNEI
ncbi:MAG: biosynthetic peptidoglycan transglycosylase [Bdellovibrionales bacterium]